MPYYSGDLKRGPSLENYPCGAALVRVPCIGMLWVDELGFRGFVFGGLGFGFCVVLCIRDGSWV